MVSGDGQLKGTRPPVMTVTRFDLVTSFLIALVMAVCLAVAWLVVFWFTNQLARPEQYVPVELVELVGGVEDGAVDETLRVDSPEEVSADPSPVETPQEQTEIREMLDTVMELSDTATELAEQQFQTGAETTGKPGSATGTGRRALGMGAGEAGLPREQRWFIAFADSGSLDVYAQQLDYFGIELGLLVPSGELIYISNLAQPQPAVRRVTSGGDEQRLYMTWRGGSRKRGDVELFRKAGVDVGMGVILHFYPSKTEAILAQLEREYRGKAPEEVRRTYFRTEGAGRAFRFVVTRQTYFR